MSKNLLGLLLRSVATRRIPCQKAVNVRPFSLSTAQYTMGDLKVDLTAPNGRKITLPTGLFINNQFIKGNGDPITSINPANEKDIATVSSASAEDIDSAVQAAREAFNDPSWRDLPPTDRGRLMYKLADLIEGKKEDLATLETWDNGKPYAVSLSEDLGEVVNTIRYYAGYADKLHGQTIPTTPGMKFAYTLRQPVGVCAQIIPWNYPLAMAAWKLGPALACGNTVVLKPAEQTPLSILLLASLVPEAGFPPGVVNIVNGYGRVAGHALASHLDVDKIAFTGSTVTGKQIMKTASVNMKNITLETGGKSPLLVFEDADMDQATKWAHLGIMSNQGQICTATSRILVQDTVMDKFLTQFKEVIASTSKVGDPFAEDTYQGPQVTKAQYDKVLSYVEAGKSEGATLARGGAPNTSINADGKGFFIEPTVFTNVNETMKIYNEEIFGPFCVIVPFKTEQDALRLANNTQYGLGSAVFTQDINRAHRVAERLEAGMVWINSSQDSDFRVPFGGVKQSGIGRELGEAGLAAYSQTKAVHVNLGLRL